MAKNALQPTRSAPAAGVDDVVGEVRALALDVAVIDPQLVEAAARAWAPNTIRAFVSDIKLWDTWCRMSRTRAGAATPQTVVGYIRALSGQDHETALGRATKLRAAATIARYLVNIGLAYRMAGLESPTDAPLARLEHKAARRILGTRQKQSRAIRYKGDVTDLDAPASGVSLTILIKAVRRDLVGLRDRALLLVNYDTGCRRSELVAMRIEDIDGPDLDGAGLIEIRRSKTDQEGQGAFAYLSPVTMEAIEAWTSAARFGAGPLFRRVETYFDGSISGVGEEALHPGTISLIYKGLVRRAFEKKLLGAMTEKELERWVEGISSHSIRVGVAQDNIAAGEALPAIMQAYRWRDAKTVMRYGAKLSAKSGASARMAARFRN